jgi:solute carrier family 35 protein E3
MSDSWVTTGYAVGNVLSSVAIVLVNKKVFAAGFHFPFSLSFFHFCFTMVFYRLLLVCGLFQLPSKPMSQLEKFKVGAAGVASIGFMNVSLSLNSVGFYQVTKLTIVPVTLVINYVFFGVSTTAKVPRGSPGLCTALPQAAACRLHI